MKEFKTGNDVLDKWKSELFSSTFFTILSIIQGVSLGFIMLNSASFWVAANTTMNYSFLIYGSAIGMQK